MNCSLLWINACITQGQIHKCVCFVFDACQWQKPSRLIAEKHFRSLYLFIHKTCKTYPQIDHSKKESPNRWDKGVSLMMMMMLWANFLFIHIFMFISLLFLLCWWLINDAGEIHDYLRWDTGRNGYHSTVFIWLYLWV